MSEEVTFKKGWLYKKAERGLVLTWSRRWFTIHPDLDIHYYVSPEGTEKGSMWLAGYSVLEHSELRHPRSIKLVPSNPSERTWFLSAATPEEHDAWVKELQLICKKVVNKKPPASLNKPLSMKQVGKSQPSRLIFDSWFPSELKVDTSVRFVNICAIDNKQQTFDADLIVVSEWNRPDLVNLDSETLGDKDKVTELITQWTPATTVQNEKESNEIFSRYRISDVSKGRVRHTHRFRGTFYQIMNLKSFPFDTQELSISFRSSFPSTVCRLVCDPNRMSTVQDSTISEWKMDEQGVICSENMTSPSLSASGTSYGEFQVNIYVHREYQFFIWNIGLIMFIIGAVSWLGFLLEPTDLPGHNDIFVTLLLTAVAFKLAVADSLPNTIYLTVLDKYIVISFLYLCLVMAMAALCSQLSLDVIDTYNKVFGWIVIIVWLSFHAFAFYMIWLIRRIEVKKLKKKLNSKII